MSMKILFWVVIAVLVIMIIMHMPAIGWVPFEHMCGGGDQHCVCSGNETMLGSKNGTPMDNDLSKVLVGK